MENLVYTIFNDLPRLGPGDDFSTRKAYFALPDLPKNAHVLDIGCGMGQQTLELARQGAPHILALDNHEPYLRELSRQAKKEKLSKRISVIHGDMQNLPFTEAEFDLIWSEGSIYIIGLDRGLKEWRKFLKSKGYLVITDVAWLKDTIPDELRRFWEQEYPGMNSLENNLTLMRKTGFDVKQYFTLPEEAWWDNFYQPLQQRINTLRQDHRDNPDMMEALDMVQAEIDMYLRHNQFYGYVFYILQKKT